MPIFDQGYQHWKGTCRATPGAGWRSPVTACGSDCRAASSGIVLLVSWLPALVLAAVLCLWGLMERKSDLVAPDRSIPLDDADSQSERRGRPASLPARSLDAVLQLLLLDAN